MHLGERLKLLREKEGYSQEELATILNLKRQSISK
ncbi:helix-turn-helix domain-containing protein [Brochothrix thermosphacta]|nr:helix-turn-helix transcriptional regulator [Brochothrix thermosphacta]